MSLHEIIAWTLANGEPMAVSRLRVGMLLPLFRCQLSFDQITPSTRAPDDVLQTAIKLASEIVGKPCNLISTELSGGELESRLT